MLVFGGILSKTGKDGLRQNLAMVVILSKQA